MKKRVWPSELKGTVEAPASKSAAQRWIAAALLAPGTSRLSISRPGADVAAALAAARGLGADVAEPAPGVVEIRGGLKAAPAEIDCGEAGLSARAFAFIAALLPGPVTLRGRGSLNARSMKMVIDPLRALGVVVESNRGRLPLTIKGSPPGGDVTVEGGASSQGITGLLLALPCTPRGGTITVAGAASRPYLEMTIEVMRAAGIVLERDGYRRFSIPGGQAYRPRSIAVEGDWSAAAALLAAGAVAGDVEVTGLDPRSTQADRRIADVLELAGADVRIGGGAVGSGRRPLRAFAFDASDCPDLFPPLTAVAAAADGTSRIAGVRRLRDKESDRARALEDLGRSLGFSVRAEEDELLVEGGPVRAGRAASWNDHRIAMTAAVLGCVAGGPVEIEDAECVAKSYPTFYDDLARLGARIEEV